MKPDLKHLRALCDAATQGEWLLRPAKHDDWGVIRSSIKDADGYNPIVCQARAGRDYDANEHRKNNTDPSCHNARFIAATDPQTVRALIDEVERYKKALEKIVDDSLDGWSIGVAQQALKGTDDE